MTTQFENLSLKAQLLSSWKEDKFALKADILQASQRYEVKVTIVGL